MQDGLVNTNVLVAGLANGVAALGSKIFATLADQAGFGVVEKALGGNSLAGAGAGALAIVYADHNVTAEIGATAHISVTHDFSVGAETEEYGQTFASAAASKPESSDAVLDVAAGIGVGIYNNTVHAFVDGGATVDVGGAFDLESALDYPP